MPGCAETLSGEHGILDGMLQLCLDLPESLPPRLLLVHTARAMRQTRPRAVDAFRARLELLQKERPLQEPAQSVLARLVAETFAS